MDILVYFGVIWYIPISRLGMLYKEKSVLTWPNADLLVLDQVWNYIHLILCVITCMYMIQCGFTRAWSNKLSWNFKDIYLYWPELRNTGETKKQLMMTSSKEIKNPWKKHYILVYIFFLLLISLQIFYENICCSLNGKLEKNPLYYKREGKFHLKSFENLKSIN
jgi:hypothetical protein